MWHNPKTSHPTSEEVFGWHKDGFLIECIWYSDDGKWYDTGYEEVEIVAWMFKPIFQGWKNSTTDEQGE